MIVHRNSRSSKKPRSSTCHTKLEAHKEGVTEATKTTQFLKKIQAEDCDVVVNDAEVSGLHCELTYEDGSWHVRDVGSTNGTSVDSEPLNVGERRQLAHGSVLTVSKISYRLET